MLTTTENFAMKKIMLVDDVDISNFIMKKMIGKVSPKYEIIDYTQPEEAIAEIDKVNPDVIFLDLNMPVINGWEFLDLMKKNNYQTTVYILTSSTNEFDIQKSKNYDNVRNFLIKPISLNSLASILTDADCIVELR